MSGTTIPSRSDLYQTLTDQIVAQLEQGARPWMKPWSAEHAAGRITRPLRANGKPQRGINVLMLWLAAEAKAYAAPIWMTYRQASELGGQIRRGEKASPVTYADKVTRKDETTNEEREIFFLKSYSVFNVDQIDGLPEHFYATAEPPALDDMQRLGEVELFFRSTGADIRTGGTIAAYSLEADIVRMPSFVAFRDVESYYATLAHECVHWTRHPSRLDRDFGRKRYGDEGYAREELVAELGSCFLAADLGLAIESREDHASYIEIWLQVLRNDKRAVFVAAAHAEKAVAYLHGLQPAREPTIDEQA